MRTLLHRFGAALFTAAAIVGLFTVTGFPEPLGRQILIALASATAVQVYIEVVRRRQSGR